MEYFAHFICVIYKLKSGDEDLTNQFKKKLIKWHKIYRLSANTQDM